MNQTTNPDIYLSLKRALLGEIFPELLAVAYESLSDKNFKLLFFLDQPASDEHAETISIIETEVMADFAPDIKISHEIISTIATHLPDNALYAYRRGTEDN